MDNIWYKPGSLVRVNEYEFEDDGSKRDKYMIVLYHNNTNALIIDCLTTTKNKMGVPAQHKGCAVHNNKLPYYFFPALQVIGKQNYYFDFDTFIFFKDNVRLEPIAKFDKYVALSIFGLVKLDELPAEELKRLIKCALKSRFVPNNIATILAGFKAVL